MYKPYKVGAEIGFHDIFQDKKSQILYIMHLAG
jgi:hypothetical protein